MADNKQLGSPVFKPGQPATSLGKPTSTLALPSAARSRSHALQQAAIDSKTQRHPGYSLFDWNRICENEQDLAGVGGRLLRVTGDELSKHNTEHDVWTAIRGRVYNVTPFLKYHPGGKAQLMKGAGIDCTALFDKIHTWVNDEVILRKCIVGVLVSGNAGGKMAQEPLNSEQHTPAVKYMTVPEKIELTPDTSDWIKGVPEPYRPITVPVKITLETTDYAVMAPAGVEEGKGGGGEPVESQYPHGGLSEARRRPKVVVDPAPLEVQPTIHGVAPAAMPPAIPADMEQRVQTLEQQVQRLTDTIMHTDGADSPRQRQGSGFWYVLTFAGLGMIPLVITLMYHYKKAL